MMLAIRSIRKAMALLGFVAVLFACAPGVLAQSVIVSGYVEDASSGERIPGAHIYLVEERVGATSNAFGFYSLAAPPGALRLSVTHVSYLSQRLDFEVAADTSLVVQLAPRVLQMDEVVVRADEAAEASEVQMSRHRLMVEEVETLPVLLGEPDLLKTMQLLPGVQAGREGFSGLYVRGGRAGQNLILLDGLPLYNPTHVLGLFSVFNTSAMKQVELIKGGFPARYGGRLSSVANFTMKEGNLKHFEGEAALGLLTSRFLVEGPIVRDRASFIFSGRRTFMDLLTWWAQRIFTPNERFGGHFHDLNFKANYLISDRDRLYVSGYLGRDAFTYRERYSGPRPIIDDFDFELVWHNRLASLRWTRLISDRWFASVLAGVTQYRVRSQIGVRNGDKGDELDTYQQVWASSALDYTTRLDMEYAVSLRHYLRFGAEHVAHRFTPGSTRREQTVPDRASLNHLQVQSQRLPSRDVALYVEDEWQWPLGVRTNAGLRLSGSESQGAFARSVEPRLAIHIPLGGGYAGKLSYAYVQQYMHLLTGTGASLPKDVWIPFMPGVRPQRSSQVAAGLARSLPEYGLELSMEGYYKVMTSQIEYRTGVYAYQALESGWPSLIEHGSGRSYGAEFFVERRRRRLNGWLSYTWARTQRTFAGLNRGAPFPDGYDRRHDVSLVLQYRLTDHTLLSWSWVYGSGYPVWSAAGKYRSSSLDYASEYVLDYGPVNASRAPAHHRLDLSVHFIKEVRRWGERTFTLGLYNVYNRQNPMVIYPDTNSDGRTQWKKLSVLQLIPAISYQLRF